MGETNGQRLDLRGTKVLVVEDHDDSRDLLGRIISSFGASVMTAADGQEALRLATADPPDLIFSDLRMPEMDGFELLARLRLDDTLRRVRVVAVSAFGAHGDFMRTWAAGFSGHLVKPIDFEIVEAQLRRIL
jgi:two-component system cell cycle response regulator DivK